MIYAGIDAGSRAIKIALFDAETNSIIGVARAGQKVRQNLEATELFEELLAEKNLKRESVAKIIGTGYGRDNLDLADDAITEITCHAKGVAFFHPDVRTIIEIGGQDSKLIKLDDRGRVKDFSMNDRCAAGTGRFLEVVADKLQVPLKDLGTYASRSQSPAPISSMCVVFAETEIIGLLSVGTPLEDIIAGVQLSIAHRLLAMCGKALPEPIVFTGGVARVSGMRERLADTLSQQITISERPQFTGAVGAALLAAARS